ncbi:ATP-NAD kinase-like domain-containing protein [Paraphoma chrysanthemicola]|uniref:ATP-NAD kinase-like domain-containing protein n=1 Tax=Paraphoma chrysanthemicola TaxID=798071 RepID=A0A8K0R8J7_9PLEO|nr:ATP-NAD kinase-like domain-containing protein [Paraphoma chrysanthemicola]
MGNFTMHLPLWDDQILPPMLYLAENEDPAQPPRLLALSPRQPPPTNPLASEVHVIISTGSGHKQALTFWDNTVSTILGTLSPDEGESTHKHITQSESTILELTRDVFFPAANAGTTQRIILLSGDGGIVDLVNGLLAQPAGPNYIAPQVVVLPLGTANALYHSINFNPDQPDQVNKWGLASLSSNTTKPLPTFTATFSPGARLLVDEARKEEPLPTNANGEAILHGAVVCSWGMHASLVADSDTSEYRKFGIERFKMAAKEALYPGDGSLPHPYRGKVSVLKANNEWRALPEDQHLYTLATLVSHLEAPFCISPRSRPLSGSLHLVHFGPTSGDEAMRLMGLAYQGGKHVDDEKVRYEEVEGVRIDFAEEEGRWRRVCVDGKIVRVEEGGWVEIRRDVEKRVEVVVAAGKV